ncbi:MAG: hypothetical protein OHK0038_04080 [Flammeovirgaceae bacterium]
MPKPLNWKKSFTYSDKIPYGCYLTFQLLQNYFGEYVMQTNRKSIYEIWKDYGYGTTSPDLSLIFINERFQINEQDLDALLKMVNQGAAAFISAHYFSDKLCDTLGFRTGFAGFYLEEETANPEGAYLLHKQLPQKTFYFKRGIISYSYLTTIPASSDILGKKTDSSPNFIRVKYGNGYFLIHTAPLAFTNYAILSDDNRDYASAVFSCLPKSFVIMWDEYYKIGREEISTPLRFILSKEALKWAYYTTIISLLLFVIFRARRKQRIIPELPPLQNTSLEFAETVGLLYFQHKDHHNLALKIILYWKEFIRNKYHLKTEKLDDIFMEELSAKSGVEIDKIKQLVEKIVFIENRKTIHEEDLQKLNHLILAFKKEALVA